MHEKHVNMKDFCVNYSVVYKNIDWHQILKQPGAEKRENGKNLENMILTIDEL